ncbi:MAG: hypothetical protein PHI37_03830 [Candidatus Gracilibacteria bacterium]|nr:hypothetical protein [Candidatus Gracilibacteria bacterium]
MKKIIIILLFFVLFSCSNLDNGKEPVFSDKKENNNNFSFSEFKTSDKKLDQLALDANNYYLNKDYENAIKSYIKLEENGVNLNSNQVFNLFNSFLYSQKFKEALAILYNMMETSSQKEKFTGFRIEENDLSQNIVNLNERIFKQGNLTDTNLVEYAKLMYKAGDYYYDYDNQKYYFAILIHYISAYLILEDAQKINPENPDIYFYKGRLLMDITGDFYQAELELKKAISLKTDHFEYYYRLGNAYMHQDKVVLAKENFLKGIELNDNYEKLYLNLGNMNFLLGEDQEGYDNYNKGLKVCHEMCDSFYFNIGKELYNSGKYEEGRKSVEKAYEINPSEEKYKRTLDSFKK